MSKRQAPDPLSDYPQAVALHHAGQHTEAQRLYRAILKRSPVHADTLHLLGLSLCQTGRYTEALTYLNRALLQRPGWVEVLINRGNALQELGEPARALADFDAALALAPDHPEALGNRGVTLYALGRLDEALADYDRALALRPAYPEALHNRGNALRALNRNDEAIRCFEAALALQPDDAEARLHLAMSRLLEGDFARAWPDYQWRWKTRQYAPHRRVFPQPEWLGHRALEGRTLLVHAEQGFGDILQFCRYAPPLRPWWLNGGNGWDRARVCGWAWCGRAIRLPSTTQTAPRPWRNTPGCSACPANSSACIKSCARPTRRRWLASPPYSISASAWRISPTRRR